MQGPRRSFNGVQFLSVVPPPSRPTRIIRAEDNPADVFLVREALKRENIDCEIHVIADGEEAIAYIDSLDADSALPTFDLLLLDLHLPRQDGESILTRLRSSRRSATVPVVVLTASDSTAEKKSIERHQAVHFFRKPSSLTEFMELGPVAKTALSSR